MVMISLVDLGGEFDDASVAIVIYALMNVIIMEKL
jgi:hypothetical protein